MSLTCTLVSQDGRIEHAFRPDEAKRSAFWLDDDLLLEGEETEEAGNGGGGGGSCRGDPPRSRRPRRRREIAGPAECLVEAFSPPSSWPRADGESESGPPSPPSRPARFCAGGFQLVSNARSVEVYLDEQLLATCRGVPSPGHNGKCGGGGDGGDGAGAAPRRYFRAVYVVPGGPRPVRKMTLRLRDLVPLGDGSGGPRDNGGGAAAETARLVMMKLTARVLLEPAGEEGGGGGSSSDGGKGASRAPASPPPALPLPPPPPAGPSEADVGSALAALSLVMRGAEERIVQSTRTCVQKQVEGGFEGLRLEIRRVGDELGAKLQRQSEMLEQQRRLIEAQQEQIRLLGAGQAELARIVAAAAAERSQRRPATSPTTAEIALRAEDEETDPNPCEAAEEAGADAALPGESDGGSGEHGDAGANEWLGANLQAERDGPAPEDERGPPPAPPSGADEPAGEAPRARSPPRDDPGEPPAQVGVDVGDILLECFPIAGAPGPCRPREVSNGPAAAASSLDELDLLLGGPRG
jgi:hypothetical protein